MYENYFKSIDVYLNEQNSDYAIMIDGSWGCGKTYFLKEKLIPYLEEDRNKKIVYISLFGMKDANDLIDNISLCALSLEAKGNSTIGAILGGVETKYKNKIESSFVVNGLSRLSGSIPYVRNLKNIISDAGKVFIDFSRYIFVFDDFERSNINLDVLLGVFSEIINQNKSKVIVVCNEQEMLNGLETKRYNNFKEKVFGVNIKFNQSISYVFDELVEKFCADLEARRFINLSKYRIIDMFVITQSNNIRTFIFAIKRFAELYNVIYKRCIETGKEKEYFKELFSEITLNVFSFSLHWKRHNVSRELKEFEEYWLFDSEYFKKEPDYKYSYLNYIKVRKPINNYICNLELMDDDIEKIVCGYCSSKDDDVSIIVNKVNNLMLQDDDLAKENLDRILKEIERDEYKLIVYPKILDKIFILLKIFEYDLNKIENFKNNVVNNIIKRANEYEYSSWSFYHFESKEVNDFIDELYRTIIETNKREKEREWVRIFKSDENFLENFSAYMEKEKGYITKGGVFANVEVDDVTERILELNNKDIIEFFSKLRLVFDPRIGNLKDFYADDAMFFKLLENKLRIKITDNNLKQTTKYLLGKWCEYLEEIYEHLK